MKITLNKTQRRALQIAMCKDNAQEMINGLTPTRGYAFEMSNTVRIVEMILNAPATRKHYLKR